MVLFERYTAAAAKYGQCAAIAGHFRFFPGDRLSSDRYNLTLLRDPVDRTLSNYFFNRHDVALAPGEQARGVDMAKSLSLRDYVFSDDHRLLHNTSNLQTRHYMELEWDGADEPTPSRQLELAIKALERFDLVGVYHLYADFVDVLCYDSGWPLVEQLPREKVTSRRLRVEEVEPDIVKRLNELNQLDLELYDYATKRFKAQKRRMMVACLERRAADVAGQGAQIGPSVAGPEEGGGSEGRGKEAAPALCADFGNRRAELLHAEIAGHISLSPLLYSGEMAKIRLVFRANEAIGDLTAGIAIRDVTGRLVFGSNNRCLGSRVEVAAPGEYCVDYVFRNDLGLGAYVLGAALYPGADRNDGCYHWRDELAPFEVVGNIGYHFEGTTKLYPYIECVIPSQPGGGEIRLVDLDAAEWPGRQRVAVDTPLLTDFSAELRTLGELAEMKVNEVIALEVEVVNTGRETWGAGGLRPVCLCYHWLDAAGDILTWEGLRTCLPKDIRSGESFRQFVTVKAPPRAGRAVLQLTLLQERVAWFDERGMRPGKLDVVIAE